MNTVWNDASRTCNPFKSDLVSKYMACSREEQKKAGILVKQAPVLLQSHSLTISAHLKTQLQTSRDQTKQVTLARDIAAFSVAFGTTKRGDELTRTLIERILRLPNDSGLLLNFQWGKKLRSGANHLMAVPYCSNRDLV